MKIVSQNKAALVRVLLIVFAMNASSAYGSCFFDADLSETQSSMPCHETESSNETVDETCCADCIGLQTPSEHMILPLNTTTIGVFSRPLVRSINSPELRYRPPITNFS